MLTAVSALLLSFSQARAAPTPRLVVMIAVDQLVPEQLQRLDARFTGGFRRLLDEGAVFWRATVDYANTETGPGHATFSTGRWPSSHGIVGNQYFDRDADKLAYVYCLADSEAGTVTATGIESGRGVSPARLVGDALADLLERHYPGSRTVAVSGKDRSAILLGGHSPDAALWWHPGSGGFTSSSHYGEKLPEFVGEWNKHWKERAQGWKWVNEVEGDLAALGTAADDRAGESSGAGRTLPRTLPKEEEALPRAVLYSPLVDYFTVELALLAADTLDLGRDDAVDCLGISLSGCDIIGHAYGPDSVEVTDVLLRADRDLGRLFATLDEQVGKGRWLACLSSDHGVLDLPEALQQRAVGARRVKTAEVEALRASVEEAVRTAHPELPKLPFEFEELGFGFDEKALRAAGVDPAALRALVAEVAEETRWVADAYTLEELAGNEPGDPWLTLYRRCRTAERGFDVVLRPEPWLLFGMPEGTSHGSPYPYDRRVPLVFLGSKVKSQQRFDAASPTDAVPSLLGLLGVEAPKDLDGRVLKLE